MGVAEAAATASASVSTIAGPAEAADFAEADDDTVAALAALAVVRGAAAVAAGSVPTAWPSAEVPETAGA
ncbi:hypothetical protein BKH30_01880 [Actinomyces oris]|uniref:Uncharacterized protein n=1 Tax=Actinomyces oris TaxID=544580 RepID=A0A1Q8W3N2_9ACTO|nr:hypothetical protein BKH30_01880 [Actinomyces oris]